MHSGSPLSPQHILRKNNCTRHHLLQCADTEPGVEGWAGGTVDAPGLGGSMEKETGRKNSRTCKIATVSWSEPREQVLLKCPSWWEKLSLENETQFCIMHAAAWL